MLDTVATLVELHAGAPWVLAAVAILAALDGVLPPVPSESVVVGLAAVTAAAQGPNLVLLGCAAALGAFVGDNLAYALGRRGGHERLARAGGPRLRAARRWATEGLERRGASVILVARYVPVGRVAVNLAAGATAFPRRRFAGLAAVGALTWAAYSVAVGSLAGRWIGSDPLLAAAVGVAVALVLGAVVQQVERRLAPRLRSARARRARPRRTPPR
jgi:membrane protein DedA with SNARE-associated domain